MVEWTFNIGDIVMFEINKGVYATGRITAERLDIREEDDREVTEKRYLIEQFHSPAIVSFVEAAMFACPGSVIERLEVRGLV